MAEHDTRQGSIPETIDRIGLLLAVCLFMAALVDSLTNWGRISLVLAAVCIAASTVLYKQFVTTGPYDPKLLFPLRFWLASLAIVLAIASTGGTGSIYIIALLYPTLLAAIQPQTQRRAVKCLLILYAALLVISLVMPGGTVMLRRWPVIPVQLAGFMFIAYWLEYLISGLKDEQSEMERVLELDRQKSEFISLASHHLRTPLSGIKGYIDFFQQGAAGELNDTQKQVVQRLDAGIRKIETLVENLLLATSMEEGKIKIHRTMGNFSLLVKSSVDQFESTAQEKGIKIITEMSGINLQEVSYDENRLREVFYNILSNAVKYTEKGFIKVVVEGREQGIVVMVQDSGIGIPQSDIPHLFQKFSRIGSVMGSFDQEGVGLGLFITRLIIEAHGGSIRVDSEPHVGSKFYFSIPRT